MLFSILIYYQYVSKRDSAMLYSMTEKCDMITIYCECRKNAVQARLLYEERYPERNTPSRRTFTNTYRLFRSTGSVHARQYKRKNPTTNEDNEINILAAIAVNPHVSTRKIAREAGISQSSVIRILARHKFHPFHISLHQELHGNDFQNRINFCQWGLLQNHSFFSNVLFTDEATFTNHGSINLRNAHYWSVDNPHWLREIDHQRQWSVNVWCGILNDKVIGPYFVNGMMTGQKYAQFLQEDLPILLEDVPLQNRYAMWYQHDGCPAHYARVARETLDSRYPNRWIGRGGTVSWPARSPDLNPLDFFLWGLLKETVYTDAPTTVEDMRQRIITACTNITSDTLIRVQHSFRARLQQCIDADGHHFEHL